VAGFLSVTPFHVLSNLPRNHNIALHCFTASVNGFQTILGAAELEQLADCTFYINHFEQLTTD
jgi:hypothetical protein